MSDAAGTVRALVADGEAGLPLGASDAYGSAELGGETAHAAAERIRSQPDAAAFHLLLALRRDAPEAYGELPAETRAAVLTGALRELPQLNDFGYMEPGGDGYDGTAARALLELGDAARDALVPLLDDDREAPLAGSETATMSHAYRYRRADFAFRYLSKLLGRDAPFAADPTDRDPAIARLRDELAGRPPG